MRLLLFVLGIGGMLFNGYALQHIWAWSAVPVFPGLPFISLWQAIGLSQLALWVPIFIPTADLEDSSGHENRRAFTRQLFLFFRAALALGISWLAHWMQG